MSKSLNTIIDRRSSKGKSAENRKKFLDRNRDSIRDAMPNIINSGSIKDIGKDGGAVVVRKKTIQEPEFRYAQGGHNHYPLPGNKDWVVGDEIKKAQSGSGNGGGKEAGEGSGEDDFVIQISREEFLNYFFEDLELPDLIKKDLVKLELVSQKNAGFSTTGSPSKLSVVRSLKQSHMRRIALRGKYERRIEALKETPLEDEIENQALLLLLEKKKQGVPFLDPVDLRYRQTIFEKKPSVSATMICIMDTSASMGEREKTLSRKFFYLLYLFLARKYEKIDLVFIRHTDTAQIVDEQEFFHSRVTGGTIVSSALKLLKDSIESGLIDRAKSNIYVCQCSDGDNMSHDNNVCLSLLREVLGDVQYYAYVQIMSEYSGGIGGGTDGTLYGVFENAQKESENVSNQTIRNDKDIYPVFRKLFEKGRKRKSEKS